jgi:hypothetical protein
MGIVKISMPLDSKSPFRIHEINWSYDLKYHVYKYTKYDIIEKKIKKRRIERRNWRRLE